MSSNLNEKIDQLTDQVLKNKKRSNFIVDLLKYASETKKIQTCVRSMNALCQIFGSYLKEKKFQLFYAQNELEMFEKNSKTLNSDEKYRLWMNQRLGDLKNLMLDTLKNVNSKNPKFKAIKIACLTGLFDLVKYETLYKKVQDNDEKQVIPQEFIEDIIDALLEIELDDKLIKKIRSYLLFWDLRYFILKYLLIDFYKKNHINETILENVLNIFVVMLGLVKDEEKPNAEPDNNTETSSNFADNGQKLFALKKENLAENSKITQQDIHRKLFNDCFVNFLKNQLSPKLYKKLLIKLPEKLIPKMTNPLMLADFLTQSYNSGGLISVLALNSLFILINNYNLEYPNFYQKVYQLLDSAIFHTKYKDRFFQLLDMFLMSTHLSSVLVAAFIKKLSRMSLTCPPGDLKFLVLFIYNLLIRHPNCKILIHNKTKADTVEDPYDINCLDFKNSNAIKSSLWEVQSLKNHYCAYVSKEIDKMNSLNQAVEFQLDDAFENNSYESIIEMELDSNKATANCAMNYTLSVKEENNAFYDIEVSNLLRIN